MQNLEGSYLFSKKPVEEINGRKSQTKENKIPSRRALKVLSIDFDVFCDMTQFMPGTMACEWDWVIEYSRWEGEFKHRFKFQYKEFERVKRYLSGYPRRVFVAEDHKKIYEIIPEGSEVELVNLDFHADSATLHSLENLDCGNWISALVKFKGCDLKVDWRQLHSKGKDQFFHEFPDVQMCISHEIGFKKVFNRQYDFVFLCQSSNFSPSHMNHRFRELVGVCKQPSFFGDSMPLYPTYSERYKFSAGYEFAYVPSGNETTAEMDAIHDSEEHCVIWPVCQIDDIPDCDPEYRK